MTIRQVWGTFVIPDGLGCNFCLIFYHWPSLLGMWGWGSKNLDSQRLKMRTQGKELCHILKTIIQSFSDFLRLTDKCVHETRNFSRVHKDLEVGGGLILVLVLLADVHNQRQPCKGPSCHWE